MGNYKTPTQDDLTDDDSFSDFVVPQQTTDTGLPRTTAAISGTTTYGATSFNVSDILQGTYSVKDQSDQLLVINQALTQDLSGLYSLNVDSSFGSVDPGSLVGGGNTPETGTSPGSGSGSQPSQGTGGFVSEQWVMSLPKVHSNGALLWRSTGKASREMHIPVSGDIEEDKAKHLQFPDMPAEWKHPYNMDRVGGWVGGQSYTPGPVDSGTIGGEDPNTPGNRAAFGYLTAVEEQFYCSMAWPFKQNVSNFQEINETEAANAAANLTKDNYRGKKVLVYSVQTGKACVCTPGDWGPWPKFTVGTNAAFHDFIIGLSPDTHYYLGTNHGTEIRLGWVDDATLVGPYSPTPEQSVPGSSPVPGVGDTTPTTAGNVSIDDIKYACQKILNHPNCWMGKPGKRVPGQSEGYATAFTSHFTNGNTQGVASEVVFKDSNGKQFLFPSLLNYLWYMLNGGFILDYYVGSIGHKAAAGNTSRLSFHCYGGAIDIGALGIATEGVVYSISDSNNWRRVCDRLFNYLTTLPENTRANEIGCSFAYTYPNNFKVYKDANPTHLHIGFGTDKTGTLLSVLKVPSSNTSPTTQ